MSDISRIIARMTAGLSHQFKPILEASKRKALAREIADPYARTLSQHKDTLFGDMLGINLQPNFRVDVDPELVRRYGVSNQSFAAYDPIDRPWLGEIYIDPLVPKGKGAGEFVRKTKPTDEAGEHFADVSPIKATAHEISHYLEDTFGLMSSRLGSEGEDIANLHADITDMRMDGMSKDTIRRKLLDTGWHKRPLDWLRNQSTDSLSALRAAILAPALLKEDK